MSESLPPPQNPTPPNEPEAQSELQSIIDRIPREWGRYVSCGKGWNNLLLDLDRELAKLSPDYTIAQVKEKFGGLRFYLLSFGTEIESVQENMNRLITQAEHIASLTCESCGICDNSVKLRGKEWVRTLCSNCEKERLEGLSS